MAKNKVLLHPLKCIFSHVFCKGGSFKIAFLLEKNSVFWRSSLLNAHIRLEYIRAKSKQKHSSKKYAKNIGKWPQKSVKNASKNVQKLSKKTRQKKNTQTQPKGTAGLPKHDRREGSRKEPSCKEKECCETKPTAGKGACWKETRRLWPYANTPLRRASTRPGGEFRLPKAIVPPPGRGKIICMRKFARNLMPGSMQEVFLQISASKDEFRPKRDETKPRGCEITKVWP